MGYDSTIRLSNVIDYVLDDDVGIIQNILEVPIESGAPNFFRFYAISCNTSAFSTQDNFRSGGGASTDRDIALAKAVGEAIERYCSAIYNPLEIHLLSSEDAPFKCVDPESFALYSKNQYNIPDFTFVPFTKGLPTRWIPAFDILENETIYVPAPMVYAPYYYNTQDNEKPIVQPVSTGLACHSNFYDASISGICEVIERDAFMITWQAMLPRSRIALESLSFRNNDLVKRFEKSGYKISLFDLTLDIEVPTVLAVSRHTSRELPPIVFAASTAMDPENAVRKSLEELEHTRYYYQTLLETLPRLPYDPQHENIVNQDDHLNFWCDRSNLNLADFLFTSNKTISFNDVKSIATENTENDLYVLLKKIKMSGYRALICDITTEDVNDLGLKVIRAIIPECHPLTFGYKVRALGGKRLWMVPQKLGYQGIEDGQDNPNPHPYP